MAINFKQLYTLEGMPNSDVNKFVNIDGIADYVNL